jgi:hypothetical protein
MEASSMETATTAEDTRRNATGRKCDHRSSNQHNNYFSEHEKLPDYSRADLDLILFGRAATSVVSDRAMQLDVIIEERRDAEHWAVRGSKSRRPLRFDRSPRGFRRKKPPTWGGLKSHREIKHRIIPLSKAMVE